MPSDWFEDDNKLDPIRKLIHEVELRLVPWGICGPVHNGVNMRGFSTYRLAEVRAAYTKSGHADELLYLLGEALRIHEYFDCRVVGNGDKRRAQNLITWEDYLKRYPGSASEQEKRLMGIKHWFLQKKLGYYLCPGCNRGIVPDAKFCVYCGSNLSPKRAI